MNDSAVLLKGEIRSWSLVGFKGLNIDKKVDIFKIFIHLDVYLDPIH